MSITKPQQPAEEIKALKNLAMLVYILQTVTIPLVVTYFIAPLIIYWKRKQAKGTWLDTHFRWQLNTFWFGLLGFVVGAAALNTPVGIFVLAPTVLWVVYRIGQGWTRLSRKQPMFTVVDPGKAG